MTSHDMFVDAVGIAARAFGAARRDGTGELHLTHALDVASAVGPGATVPELTTAVLHDVLEDTSWTADELADLGVDETVLGAVTTLTRRPNEDDDAFVARICATPGVVGATAQRVKLADLEVNLAAARSLEERERFERSIPVVREAVERRRTDRQ